MRVLLLTALVALPASAASPRAASAPLFSAPAGPERVIPAPARNKSVINPSPRAALGLCPPTSAQMAADKMRAGAGRELFHRLTKLPPATEYVAVYRQVDGCEAPIIVRYGLGR